MMSSSTHIDSRPGSLSHESRSVSLGMPCRGSLTVRSVDKYSQSQLAMLFSTPKHLFKLGS